MILVNRLDLIEKRADGGVDVPSALQPYMGGRKVIAVA